MTLNQNQQTAVDAVTAAFEADNDALQRANAEKQLLQTQFDLYKETHPDAPAQHTLMGSSINGPLFTTLGYKQVPVTRVYLRNLPKGSTWKSILNDKTATDDITSATQKTQAGGVMWISWKETDPALVDAFLATMPKDLPFKVWGTVHHEPENDTITPASWVAKQKVQSPIARKYGLKFVTILMRYTFQPASGKDWQAYFPADLSSYVDIFGADSYNLGNKKGTYSDVSAQLKPISDAAKLRGLPWAIGETGASIFNGQADVRAQWANQLAEEAEVQGATAICWWDQDSYVFDAPTANVWFT